MDYYDIFIGKLYDTLINSKIISSIGKKPDLKTKREIVEKYIQKLDLIQQKAKTNEKFLKVLKNFYYSKYIIKPDNISENYFKTLEKRYLDGGYGHHNLRNPECDIDKELRNEHINTIIREQKSSLDVWINYLLSKDSDYLPIWAKIWAFQGMLNIGILNKDKNGYGRRSNTSVNPFIEMDAEILNKCYKLVIEYFNYNKDTLNADEINKLIKSGSFAKLYGKLLVNKKQLKIMSNDGVWIKYNYESPDEVEEKELMGIEPEYQKLYKSLQGYNTGWCTAGSLETAKDQMCGSNIYCGGDFYVYYTKDANGDYKVPRIAIRMDEGSIGEIRGVAQNQNIENSLEEVLEEKLKEFPDGKTYQKKVDDMKKLTNIYDNYQHRDLTKEELIFLYEKESTISEFGYGRDPRIDEIIKKRNKRKDLAIIYSCLESQIGLFESDLYKHDILYYDGYIDTSIYNRILLHNHTIPKYIGGNLSSNLYNGNDLSIIEIVYGDVQIYHLDNAYDLKLPKLIKGKLRLDSLVSCKNLKIPECGGSIFLRSLKRANGLEFSEIENGSIYLDHLTTAENIRFPKIIKGGLYLDNLKRADGLCLSEIVFQSLYLKSLKKANELQLPKSVNGTVYLDELFTAKGITFPEHVGSLYMPKLTTTEGLVLPKIVEADLILTSLTTTSGLNLPEPVIGFVTFNNKSMNYEDFVKIHQEENNNYTLSRGKK